MPLAPLEPLHAPLAVHVVPLLEDHVMVALCPSVIEVGFAVTVIDAGLVDGPPP
jgi:hypothetical protein